MQATILPRYAACAHQLIDDFGALTYPPGIEQAALDVRVDWQGPSTGVSLQPLKPAGLRKMRLHFAFVCVFGALSVAPLSASSAPQAALNKTVTLSWAVSGSGKSADGAPVSFTNTVALTIYVSTAGRTFLRKRVTSMRGKARESSKGPGESGAYPGSVRFEGSKMVGVQTWANGATQYSVTFDPGFSSCSLSVIDGKGAGGKISRKGPDGRMYVIDSVSVSSPTCSIQSGNAFAQ